MSRNNTYYIRLWGLFCLIILFYTGVAQDSSESLTDIATKDVNETAKAASDSIGQVVKKIDKKLQEQVDWVNKKFENLTEKGNKKIEEATTVNIKTEAPKMRKNHLLNRAYHNTTAYYNVYFNGKDSYNEGMRTIAEGYPFDYTNILPITPLHASEVPSMVNAEMVRALEKGDKTIRKHSITTKPKIKKGKKLTKRQQAFYNKRDFCNSIDDAYLLIGKANTYLHEFDLAVMAFELIITEFRAEPIAHDARFWKLIANKEMSNTAKLEELETILKEKDKELKRRHRALYYKVKADILIQEKKYEEAIPAVKATLKYSWNWLDNQRYHFILAQLYQRTYNGKKAISHYSSVIRRMPPYDMEFNAKLYRAFVRAETKGGSMRKTLEKMAKDEKNKDHLGKIYYALANIEMKDKQVEKAIAYYKLSAAHSKNGDSQRVISCLTLAKFFESKSQYEDAQLYYDSTAMVMPKTDPEYEEVNNKAKNLGKLAKNLRIIKTQDSLQRIGRMNAKEREKYVSTQIAQARALEAKKKREEELRLARAAKQAQLSSNLSSQTSGKWYFYNPQVLSKGTTEFKRIWGNRPLGDNWRQSNKNNTIDFSKPETTKDTAKEKPIFTPEYYLANVPTGDSMMRASDSMILSAMFDASLVYKDYLNDKPAAIKMLEDMNKRFTSHRYQLESYFYLYITNSQIPNEERAEYYKNILITNYPNELLTKYVIDPNYVSDHEVQQAAANTLFEKALEAYHQNNYTQARRLAQQGHTQYSKLPITANFKLLYTMADAPNGSIGDYITALTSITKTYPNTNVATAAQEMIKAIKGREKALIEEKNTKPIIVEKPKIQYSTEDGTSQFVLTFAKGVNINQLKFNFIAFNADINADEYSVNTQDFSKDLEMLTVGNFKNQKEAIDYYKKIANYPTIFKDIKIEQANYFTITNNNLTLLQKSSDISLYLTFFKTLLEQ
ncbi:MAG: tetratricopeptide repeat protein [Bacteroidales bacterium]